LIGLEKRLLIPVIIALVFVFLVVVFMWNSGGLIESKQSAFMSVETEKNKYKIGEKIKITLSIVNNNPNEISIPSLGYSLEITGSEGVVLLVTETRSGIEPVSIDASSETFVDIYEWDQKDVNGGQVPSGTYTIRVQLLEASLSSSTEIEIE
jgi:hypothetical protein